LIFSSSLINQIYTQKGESDVSQIDPVFIEEAAQITPSEETQLDKTEQSNFEGFTYVSSSNIAATN
jgi:hypothetical protein